MTMTSNQQKDIVVVYHAECPDGFGAAWSAWRKFGDSASYIPLFPRTPPPEGLGGKEVYILDYSFTADETRGLVSIARRVVFIDHHISAKDILGVVSESRFDIDHSGSVLAWIYFHPDDSLPRLLKHVEDNDLWQFKLPYTRELISALRNRDFDFGGWNNIAIDFEDEIKRQKYIEEGIVLITEMWRRVAELVRDAEEVEFEGYRCLMVNSPMYVSQIGAELVKKRPPIGIIWSRRGKRTVISLRSNGSVDVSEIATKHGGGGHRAAAGFSWLEDGFLKFKSGK